MAVSVQAPALRSADAQRSSRAHAADGETPIPRPEPAERRWFYWPVSTKFALALLLACAWFAFSLWIAHAWVADLAALTGWPFAVFAVGGVALVPGFMNAFLVASLLLDRRPRRRVPPAYPGVSVIVAAYNEEGVIGDTLRSLRQQDYPGPIEFIIVDDGSTDGTASVIRDIGNGRVRLIQQDRNRGKAQALNRGLAEAVHPLIVSIDADSTPQPMAVRHLVERYLSDPVGTAAVAGAVFVRNSRSTLVARAQEWDYFHGIAAVKRMQSLYQGVLVAQGAFSLYERDRLLAMGGWRDTVGEDIVLTWGLLAQGCRIGYAEDAICFTHVPETLAGFVRQRRRWARGMFEALRAYPGAALHARPGPRFFVWWNLFYPWLDLAYTFAFMPGVILALFFGVYWLAGPLTLLLLPGAVFVNTVMFVTSENAFKRQGLAIRQNRTGFLLYMLFYSAVLQPASVLGYVSELLSLQKRWGTK